MLPSTYSSSSHHNMSTRGLLEINPPEVRFQFKSEKLGSCLIQLSNKSDHYNIAFLFKKAGLVVYRCEPYFGTIPPLSTQNVIITKAIVAQKDLLHDDEIRLYSAILSPEIITEPDKIERLVREHELPIVSSSSCENVSWSSSDEEMVATTTTEYPIDTNPCIVGHLQSPVNSIKYRVQLPLDPNKPSNVGHLQLPNNSIKCRFQMPLDPNKPLSFQLSNRSPKNNLIFLITTPEKYSARPNFGVIVPRSACEITVIMQAQQLHCDDKFSVRMIELLPWMITNFKTVDEIKLEVLHGLPPQAGSSLGLLEINPSKVKFPLELKELKERSSCSIQLTNKSNHYIAFRFRLDELGMYRCKPYTGVVLPRSTCNVIITKDVQDKATQDVLLDDEIRLHSVILCTEIFTEYSDELKPMIRENKLPIVFDVSPPPSRKENTICVGWFGKINPGQLQFPIELNKMISSSVLLSNGASTVYVVFICTTTAPNKYSVWPCFGVLEPNSSSKVIVTMPAQPKVPEKLQCNDKFLVRMIEVTAEFITKCKTVDEVKLEVLRRLPPQPSLLPVPGASQEGSSLKILEINSPKVEFPFELKEQSSCLIKLSNKSDHYIAFCFMLGRWGLYCCKPDGGAIPPQSTCNVIITRDLQDAIKVLPDEATRDLLLHDQIRLSSVILSPDMFTQDLDEIKGLIHENKLPIVHVSPPQEESSIFLRQSERKEKPIYVGLFAEINPGRLQFPLELDKPMLCSVLLSNKSSRHCVVFIVTTTTPEKYSARPYFGVLQPSSTCEVVVTMPAQQKLPPRSQCKDMFSVRMIEVLPSFIRKCKNVDEVKLELLTELPPQSPLPVPEEPQAVSSRQELIMKLSKIFKEKSAAWTEASVVTDPALEEKVCAT